MPARRPRIQPGDLIQHIDSRRGRVIEVWTDGPIPLARVEWFGGGEEILAWGFVFVARETE